MTSAYAAFSADDTLVEIIPSFDWDGKIPIHSNVTPGPFRAGLPTIVPLWMALFLHQRSVATLVPPDWWTTPNLAAIIALEKRQANLFPTTTAASANNQSNESHHDDTNQRQYYCLPENYYELSKRLSSASSTNSSSSSNATTGGGADDNPDAVSLLVQDLFEIRIDKLRQQLQELLQHAGQDFDLLVDVTGIGTQELAMLRKFVQQALADQHFLKAAAGEGKSNKATPTGSMESTASVSTAGRGGSSRDSFLSGSKRVSATTTKSVEDPSTSVMDAAKDGLPEGTSAPRPKLSLRRFRN